MTVGEVISLLTACASEHDGLLMRKGISDIEIIDNKVVLYFSDYNTADYIITGKTECKYEYRRND